MWEYNYDPYLCHHGVKGMKWGVRRKKPRQTASSKSKKHLGIDEHGNLNLVRGKTSKQGAIKFVAKTAIAVTAMSVGIYLSKNPQIVAKGADYASKFLSKNGSKLADNVDDYGRVYSKTLGRILTMDEMIAKGYV